MSSNVATLQPWTANVATRDHVRHRFEKEKF